MRKFGFVFLILLATVLSFISYRQIPAQQQVASLVNQTPVMFAHQIALQKRQLDQAIESYQGALEYMTFSSERRKLQQKLITALRDRINLTPSEPSTWQALATAEYQFELSFANRQFALQRALIFNSWDDRRKANLAHLCLTLNNELADTMANHCDALLLNYKWNSNLDYQARQLRVTPELLEARLTALGILK